MIDAKAQAKIFADDRVFPHIDKNESIISMDEVWGGKLKRAAEVRVAHVLGRFSILVNAHQYTHGPFIFIHTIR